VDITDQLARVRKALDSFEKKTTPENLENVSTELAKLEQVTPGATVATDIATFFQTVGEGVVTAQERLDRKSGEYIRNREEHALPSVFRIPKAAAEISFAMQRESSEKFSVLIYGAGDSRQQSQQHKISFEIMAVPPPPELMATLALERPLDLVFVASAEERQQVQKTLRSFARRASAAEKERAQEIAREEHFRRTLVLRDGDQWLLLRVVQLKHNLVLDVVSVPAVGTDVKLDPKLDDFVPDNLRPVVDLIQRLGEQQEQQLGARKR
jgi:hypothetical protein